MDFFERFFNLAPDGGSGALEAVYAVLAVLAVAAVVFRRRLRRALGDRAPAHRERVEP